MCVVLPMLYVGRKKSDRQSITTWHIPSSINVHKNTRTPDCQSSRAPMHQSLCKSTTKYLLCTYFRRAPKAWRSPPPPTTRPTGFNPSDIAVQTDGYCTKYPVYLLGLPCWARYLPRFIVYTLFTGPGLYMNRALTLVTSPDYTSLDRFRISQPIKKNTGVTPDSACIEQTPRSRENNVHPLGRRSLVTCY